MSGTEELARRRVNLAILKIRADFLRIAATRIRAVTPGLILQAGMQPSSLHSLRVGFTATRKLGGAVKRNRAKRRLRAVAAAVLARRGQAGTDYVLIARAATAQRPYAALVADLESALRRVGHDIAGARARGAVKIGEEAQR